MRWSLQRIWKFLFLDGLDIGRFRIAKGVRCVRVNQLSGQNYGCTLLNARAKLPDLAAMVFTDAIVNFTCFVRVELLNIF